MPIYDLTYRGYRGQRARIPVWLPLAENTIRQALRNKVLRSLYTAAGIPVLIAIVMLYIQYQVTANIGARRGVTMRGPWTFDLERYYGFLFGQGMIALVIAVVIGASAIGGDRRGNALEAIFSRPITLRQYLFGRWLGLFSLVLAATLIPGVIIWYFDNAFSLDPDRFAITLAYPFKIAAWSVAYSTSVSLLILAFSALISRAGIAMATFAAFFFLSSAFTQGIAKAVERVSDSAADVVRSFGFVEAQRTMQAAIFGLTKREANVHASVPASIAILAAIALACVIVLVRRVKPIEVVS